MASDLGLITTQTGGEISSSEAPYSLASGLSIGQIQAAIETGNMNNFELPNSQSLAAPSVTLLASPAGAQGIRRRGTLAVAAGLFMAIGMVVLMAEVGPIMLRPRTGLTKTDPDGIIFIMVCSIFLLFGLTAAGAGARMIQTGREFKWMLWVYLAMFCAIAATASNFSFFGGLKGSRGNENERASSQAVLDDLVRGINRKAPRMVTPELRLDQAVAGPGSRLTINHRFVNHVSGGKQADALIGEKLRSAIKTTVSTSEAVHDAFKAGIDIEYRYLGKDGRPIVEMVVTAADCR